MLVHTAWFVAWFAFGLGINLVTLIVSLEAIYITLFIGVGQQLQDKRSAIQAQAQSPAKPSTSTGVGWAFSEP